MTGVLLLVRAVLDLSELVDVMVTAVLLAASDKLEPVSD